MVSAKTIDLIIKTVKERGVSYETIAEKALVSKTTVYRLLKERNASSFTIAQVAAYLEIGDQVREIEGRDVTDDKSGCEFASELVMELRELRAYYEAKAVSVRDSYEERVAYLRERLGTLAEERRQEREDQKAAYERNIQHLMGEIAEAKNTIRDLNHTLDEKRRQIAKKDRLLTGALVAAGILLLAVLIFMFTDSILR